MSSIKKYVASLAAVIALLAVSVGFASFTRTTSAYAACQVSYDTSSSYELVDGTDTPTIISQDGITHSGQWDIPTTMMCGTSTGPADVQEVSYGNNGTNTAAGVGGRSNGSVSSTS